MRILKSNDYKLFEQIVAMKQPALLKAMSAYLKRHYDNVCTTKDYIYAVGDIPVTIVAHLDTVFKEPVSEIYYDERKNVMWSPEGLGADDRAGVFAIVKIIRAGHKPHIILTTDEEMGGLGAEALVRSVPQPFAEMKYIIELDRRGTNDCVFYDCENPAFVEYVESFGFIENFGSYSDICEICPVWKVAGVNLSIGYQDEHSIAETLHISPFLSTIDKVIKMLQAAKDAPSFEYIPNPYAYKWGMLGKGGWATEEWLNCAKCKHMFSEYELFPVKCIDNKTRFYCPDCIVGEVHWCTVCGEAFEIDPNNPEQHICKDCQGGTVECIPAKSQKSKISLKQ